MVNSPLIRKLVRLALEEDLSLGDVTSNLTVPEGAVCKAEVVAREDLVVCGLDLAPVVLQEMGALAETEALFEEGKEARPGNVLLLIEGNTRDILGAERTIVNFLQRACGVATYTRKFVAKTEGLVVLDTRKTMPGFRLIDKYAVATGGGRNHRLSLGDMVMVKNNHVDCAEGSDPVQKMRNCLNAVFGKKPFYMPVEVEVRSVDELKVALEFKPNCVMLDNFASDRLPEALKYVSQNAPGVQVEVSGGVTEEKLKSLQKSGVKCISAGALTTRAPAVDISMRIAASR